MRTIAELKAYRQEMTALSEPWRISANEFSLLHGRGETNFDEVSLEAGADLSHHNLKGLSFRYANLADVKFRGSHVTRSDFSYANLTEADFRHVAARRCKFAFAGMRHFKATYAEFQGSNFYKARLMGADLYGADLSECTLIAAEFSGADLYSANLRDAKLQDSEFIHVSLGNTRGRMILSVSCIGSREAETVFYRVRGRKRGPWELRINCGCQIGITEAEFLSRLDADHGTNRHAVAYRAALDMARAVLLTEV